jgi:hypothetical protein
MSLIAVLPFLLSMTTSREETVAFIRARFVESTQLARLGDTIPEQDRRRLADWYGALVPAWKQPTDVLLEAIDISLHGENVDERSGALNAYISLVHSRRVEKDPRYFRLFLELLERDKGGFRFYTNSLVSALMLYPSPETVSVLMEFGARATAFEDKENYISLAADMLGIDLPIFKQTKPLERMQMVASFQAWYEKNKDRIRFDSEGSPSIKGANVNAKPRALTTEERMKIRKDPACVLELLQGSSAGIEVSEERLKELTDQCGEALFGPDGVRLMKEMANTAQKSGSPSFDQQMSLAAARGNYPMLDAGLLAVAYVAADDADPRHRDLAKKTLDDLGMPEDIQRVLKREPKDVREKAMALAEEMNNPGR